MFAWLITIELNESPTRVGVAQTALLLPTLLFILIGWTIWLGSVFNIAILLLFIWYITVFQIVPEEKVLEVLFAEEFESYRSRVRRWI